MPRGEVGDVDVCWTESATSANSVISFKSLTMSFSERLLILLNADGGVCSRCVESFICGLDRFESANVTGVCLRLPYVGSGFFRPAATSCAKFTKSRSR